MCNRPLLSMFFASIALSLAACGSGSDESAEVDGAQEPPAGTAGVSAGGGGDFPAISSRTYTAGSARLTVSGFFTMDANPGLNLPASITDDGSTWLQYGDSGAEAANATITFHDGESGVVVAQGPYTATGGGDECKTSFDVTDAKVAGHFSCAGLTGYDKSSGHMGNVDIDVRFDAAS
jgi:hypothetical protein